jgi:hypothetical protein
MIIISSTGCGTFLLPPKGIPVARQDYLEAINTSWKEQLLSNLVKLHHGDSLTFLDMSQVTTSYNSTSNFGVAYAYNWGSTLLTGPSLTSLLVPAGKTNSVSPAIGTAYAVSPSVAYAAIKGDNLRTFMMEPIDLLPC